MRDVAISVFCLLIDNSALQVAGTYSVLIPRDHLVLIPTNGSAAVGERYIVLTQVDVPVGNPSKYSHDVSIGYQVTHQIPSSQLELADLAKRCEAAILDDLHSSNIIDELFNDFAWRFAPSYDPNIHPSDPHICSTR